MAKRYAEIYSFDGKNMPGTRNGSLILAVLTVMCEKDQTPL